MGECLDGLSAAPTTALVTSSNLLRFDKLRALGNKKDITLIDGYIRAIQDVYIIPKVINQYICLFYISIMQQLTWSNAFYTEKKLSFEENRKLVVHNTSSGYASVSADIEPISDGI